MPISESLKITGYEPTKEPNKSLITALVAIDRAHYGEYGANEEYFRKKLSSDNARVLVVEESGKPTGFCVVEFMNPGQSIDGFCNPSIPLPQKKWMHIIAFTTKTDFQDKDADKALLSKVEETAQKLGSTTFCVPLSLDHPYPQAYPFFEGNGYQKRGTIDWIAGPNELIPCNFLVKNLSIAERKKF